MSTTGELCGASGFDMLDRSDAPTALWGAGASASAGGVFAAHPQERSMLVACRARQTPAIGQTRPHQPLPIDQAPCRPHPTWRAFALLRCFCMTLARHARTLLMRLRAIADATSAGNVAAARRGYRRAGSVSLCGAGGGQLFDLQQRHRVFRHQWRWHRHGRLQPEQQRGFCRFRVAWEPDRRIQSDG